MLHSSDTEVYLFLNQLLLLQWVNLSMERLTVSVPLIRDSRIHLPLEFTIWLVLVLLNLKKMAWITMHRHVAFDYLFSLGPLNAFAAAPDR